MSIFFGDKELAAGQDLIVKCRLIDASKQPVNPTGKTFSFYAVNEANANDSFTVTNTDFTITNATDGRFQFTIARATTLTSYLKRYKCDLWTINSGANDTIAHGFFAFTKPARPAV